MLVQGSTGNTSFKSNGVLWDQGVGKMVGRRDREGNSRPSESGRSKRLHPTKHGTGLRREDERRIASATVHRDGDACRTATSRRSARALHQRYRFGGMPLNTACGRASPVWLGNGFRIPRRGSRWDGK